MAAMKQPHLAVYLGDDVLIDILSRLPTLDLCRCKCVSKQWHSSLVPLVLAQRPNYLDFFCLHNWKNSKPLFLSMSDNGDIHDDQHLHQLPLSTIFDDRRWSETYIVGVCNGAALFCLYTKPPTITRNRYMQSVHSIPKYAVYNPFTRQASMVRHPPRANNTSSCMFPFLAFDPRISSHRFKVVTLKEPDPLVYSSETKKWRPLRSRKPINCCHSYGPGSDCMNGKAYKLVIVHSAGQEVHSPGQEVIMVFDVKEECSWLITSPSNPICGHWKQRMLGESAGHLCYALYDFNLASLRMWVLDDPSSGKWVCRHNVELQPELFSSSMCSSLCFHPVDDGVLFATTSAGTRYLYYFKSSELREVAKVSDIMIFFYPYLCPW